MKQKKQWTKETGRFSIGPDDGGAWSQTGLNAGFASVSVYNPAACVLVNAIASMSPTQARQLARVLMDAADKAESLTFKVTATPIKKVLVRHSKHADEGKGRNELVEGDRDLQFEKALSIIESKYGNKG